MNTRRPLIGLLIFSYHGLSGSLAIALPLILLTGVIGQVAGVELLMQFFLFFVMGAIPYMAILKSSGIILWEQFQISMPIKRTDVATSAYLAVFLASLVGIPIIAAVWGLGVVLNSGMNEYMYNSLWIAALVHRFSLLFTALIYPLAVTKLGKRNESALSLICAVASGAITVALTFVGENLLELSINMSSLFAVAISYVAFIVSLLITRYLYTKIDF